ncbi:MAG: diguanylate cyclase domain-containing protein [Rubrobacteraceae bacterium]
MRSCETLFEHHPDAVFSLDPDCLILDANKPCEELSGRPVEELLSTPFTKLVAEEDLASASRHVRGAAEGGARNVETSLDRRCGRKVELEATIIPTGNGVAGVYLICRDVTARKACEKQLLHRALHDPLTDLPNRILFDDRLEQALFRIGRYGSSAAVLFVDLDGFKAVNDRFGHPVGDRVLVSVADLLRSSVRPGDTVARLGGDEFVILLEDLAEMIDANRVAERILTKLRRSSAARTPAVTASIGIAWQHDPGDRSEILVRRADAAMYRAKNAGGNRYEAHERRTPDVSPRTIFRLPGTSRTPSTAGS